MTIDVTIATRSVLSVKQGVLVLVRNALILLTYSLRLLPVFLSVLLAFSLIPRVSVRNVSTLVSSALGRITTSAHLVSLLTSSTTILVSLSVLMAIMEMRSVSLVCLVLLSVLLASALPPTNASHVTDGEVMDSLENFPV